MDRVAFFIDNANQVNEAGIPMGTLLACEAELSRLEADGLYAMEADAEGAKKGVWAAIMNIVHKIVEWFKALPGRIMGALNTVKNFFAKIGNEVTFRAKDAHYARKIQAVAAKMDKIADEVVRLTDEATKIAQSDPSDSRIDELNSKIAELKSQENSLMDELASMSDKRNENIDKHNGAKESDTAFGQFMSAAMEADDAGGPTTKVNVGPIKNLIQSIMTKVGNASKKASAGAAAMEKNAQAAANSDNPEKRSVFSKLAKAFKDLGHLLGGLPARAQNAWKTLMEKRAQKNAPATDDGDTRPNVKFNGKPHTPKVDRKNKENAFAEQRADDTGDPTGLY